jgi:hypothetical protein
MTLPSLLPIIAHARSGALSHAWRLFREAGLEGVTDDPGVLSLRGRLLKDEALAVEGEARRGFYLQAAGAYRAAAQAGGGTYPLINAAALALLAGDPQGARDGAVAVLEALDLAGPDADTPYYLKATEAEARLLMGEVPAAQAALAEAMARAPQAWEDHASTLRQFALILAEQGADATWLDPLRPPRVLHFAGHTGLAADDHRLADEVRAIVTRERIGFAHGALAAGADIAIAEVLLAQGCELRLVLPARPDLCREVSAARFGADWAARFDACLDQATGVRWLENDPGPPNDLDIRVAAEIAMGLAQMQAVTLCTEAVQVLVLDRADPPPGDRGAPWIGQAWAQAGRRQHVLVHPRAVARPHEGLDAAPPDALAAAVLTVEVSPGEAFDSDLLTRLAAAVAQGPQTLVPPRWLGGQLSLAYAAPGEAASAALALQALGSEARPLGVGGHYGPVRRGQDPFTGVAVISGSVQAVTAQLLASVPPNAIHVTEDFAAALQALPRPAGVRAECVGELPGGDIANVTRLFALRSR